MEKATIKAIVGGFLAAVGAGLAYLVWTKLSRNRKKSKRTSVDNRTPGDASSSFTSSGSFGRRRPTLAIPPAIGPYGAVGIATNSDETYTPAPVDTRVPSFLEGATGGVQDPAMPGIAPRPIQAVPSPFGSAQSAEYKN